MRVYSNQEQQGGTSDNREQAVGAGGTDADDACLMDIRVCEPNWVLS